MDHDDRFRSLFGFPGSRFGGFGGLHSHPGGPFDRDEEDEGDLDDGNDIFSRFRFGTFGRSAPFHDMNEMFKGAETMLRHMDSLFRDLNQFGELDNSFGRLMGPNDVRKPHGNFNNGDFEQSDRPTDDPYWNRRRSPRDEMLKVPDSVALEDRGLDLGFGSGFLNVDEIPPRENRLQPYDKNGRPRVWSQGMSSVTSFVGLGNGKVEQRKSTQNSDGSQSITVTRRLGDREVNITTRVDRNGEMETEEDLVNMDENDRADFDAEWNSGRSPAPARLDHGDRRTNQRHPESYPLQTPMLDPQAPSIFSRLFGSWWK